MVGKYAGSSRVRKDDMDYKGYDEGERNAPAPGANAVVGVARPDYSITVLIKVFDMLLGDLWITC